MSSPAGPLDPPQAATDRPATAATAAAVSRLTFPYLMRWYSSHGRRAFRVLPESRLFVRLTMTLRTRRTEGRWNNVPDHTEAV
ncbi:hypothetical protein Pen02_53800 [Plantactinospora endophytica]|uniref:Uncharacterized protein n=1 Tax=Plantactinospora endophytica TaxID=673535 RepID=A0ABQ4E6V0_9ACTN|nr:hypothetical protein Pen02_53800 [Plantactinospora endophytica]